MKWKWLNEKRALCFVFMVALILLSVPSALRLIYFGGLLMGSEPYYHTRFASEIAQQGIPSKDSFVFDERPYKLNPYHVLLALTSKSISIELASMLLPVLFGLISLFLFYVLLKKFGFNFRTRLLSLLILIISPAFVASFTLSNPHCFAILLSLLALYLFLQQKRLYTFLSSLIFITTVFFSFFNALITALFLLFYGASEKRRSRICFTLFFTIILAGLIYHYPNFLTQTIYTKNIFSDFLSDLGADIGFGFFNVILAGLGFVVKWRKKKRVFFFYALTIFFVLSLLLLRAYGNAYLNFVFALFASLGFMWLIEFKWEISLLKNLTTMVIVCGLIFSPLSYLNRVSVSMPNEKIVKSLGWLRSYASPEDVVFSHYSYGFWIEYFTKNKAFIDDFRTPNHESIWADYNTLLYSRSLEKTLQLLSNYNIKYVWISHDMRSGLVWSREQEGLLFLLGNSESFKKVYDESGIEIWEYVE